jgi:preprotein translocase subunit YajC
MAATGSDPILTIAYVAVIIGIFYFLWYRPQQTQRKKLKDMLLTLKPGDEVMTAGGLIGTLRAVDGDIMTVEIADGVRVRFTKRAIIDRLTPASGPGDE